MFIGINWEHWWRKVPQRIQWSGKQTKPTPSADAKNTSDWKTYKNTNYGFQLELPTTWDALDDKSPVIISGPRGSEKLNQIVIKVGDLPTAVSSLGKPLNLAGRTAYRSDWQSMDNSGGYFYNVWVTGEPSLIIGLGASSQRDQSLVEQIIYTIKFSEVVKKPIPAPAPELGQVVGLPDLTIENIKIEPTEPPKIDWGTTITIYVKNIGNTSVEQQNVDLLIDLGNGRVDHLTCGVVPSCLVGSAKAIEPGGFALIRWNPFKFSQNKLNITPSSTTITFTVNPDGKLKESDLSNNTLKTILNFVE
ncbi:MAG: hypothetical protein HYT48_00865 [Candidatus Vogelbacteria bacterium]|nr:hypothetical protein [Candidatus Vogelbacteria bacterium]